MVQAQVSRQPDEFRDTHQGCQAHFMLLYLNLEGILDNHLSQEVVSTQYQHQHRISNCDPCSLPPIAIPFTLQLSNVRAEHLRTEHLKLHPFFEGGPHPFGETAKSSEQLVSYQPEFPYLQCEDSKSVSAKCENLADKTH